MRIGIDARLYGLEHAGIGRYVMNLIKYLPEFLDGDELVVFGPKKVAGELPKEAGIIFRHTETKHYSFSEQWQLPKVFKREKLDLLHVPHFNLPVLYSGKVVVTIHDLLWHQSRGAGQTTLPPLKYALKYRAYKLVVDRAVKQSKAIVVPSHFIKGKLIELYPGLPENKIKVTYEGVDDAFFQPGLPASIKGKKAAEHSPFFVYTGSAYPHKNLETLLLALNKLNQEITPPIKLILVGSRSVFRQKVSQEVTKLNLTGKVIDAGYMSDGELTGLYSQAVALVHPSKSEGFGLTGLEAMAAGTAVLAARAGSLPEVYGQAAVFFDPENPQELAFKMRRFLENQNLREKYAVGGREWVKKYSFSKMAGETAAVYHQVAGAGGKPG